MSGPMRLKWKVGEAEKKISGRLGGRVSPQPGAEALSLALGSEEGQVEQERTGRGEREMERSGPHVFIKLKY